MFQYLQWRSHNMKFMTRIELESHWGFDCEDNLEVQDNLLHVLCILILISMPILTVEGLIDLILGWRFTCCLRCKSQSLQWTAHQSLDSRAQQHSSLGSKTPFLLLPPQAHRSLPPLVPERIPAQPPTELPANQTLDSSSSSALVVIYDCECEIDCESLTSDLWSNLKSVLRSNLWLQSSWSGLELKSWSSLEFKFRIEIWSGKSKIWMDQELNLPNVEIGLVTYECWTVMQTYSNCVRVWVWLRTGNWLQDLHLQNWETLQLSASPIFAAARAQVD